MANSISAKTAIPAAIKQGQPKGLIYPVEVVLADTSAGLDLYTPASDKYATCLGMIISQVGAFTGVISSAAGELFQIDIPANCPPIIIPMKTAIFSGSAIGEKIVLTRSAGSLVKAMFYFTDTGRLVPGY